MFFSFSFQHNGRIWTLPDISQLGANGQNGSCEGINGWCLQHSCYLGCSSFLWKCIKPSLCAKSPQSCPTLCDPMDCSLPDSSVHGIFQARVLEWGAIASLRSSRPRDWTLVSCVSYTGMRVRHHQRHLGSSSLSWSRAIHPRQTQVFLLQAIALIISGFKG